MAQLVKNPLQCRRPQFDSWVRKIPWRRDRLPTLVFLGFPGGSAGKESTCNAGDLGLIPGLGRSPGEGKGYLLQYSGQENYMDCILHGVSESWTRLSDFHYGLKHWSPTFLAPGTSFVEQFFHGLGGRNGLGMIQVRYIYCILYFYSNAAAVLIGGTVHTQRLGTLGLKSAGRGSGEGV